MRKPRRKADLTPEQYARKLETTSKWKLRNIERERQYRADKIAKDRPAYLAIRKARNLANAEKCRAEAKAHYWANQAKRLAYATAYREANREIIRIKHRAWRDANKDIAESATRAWKAKNPDNGRLHTAKRRARKKANGGRLSRGIVKRLMLAQSSLCAYCSAQLQFGYHIDHIQPLSRGGEHTDANVQLTCTACNMRKHNKTHEEFLALRAVA